MQILKFKLSVPQGVRLQQATGSLLHGVLMEHIDKDYATALHEQRLRPYSQYLAYNKEENVWDWQLAVLNEQAQQELLAPAEVLPNKFLLKHNNVEVEIVDRKLLPAITYDELAGKHFLNDSKLRYIDLQFVTSCSFKRDGGYVIFPQPELLISGLLRKWNIFADSNKLQERNLVASLCSEIYVADYRMQMQSFPIEGIRIPAFRGTYRLGLRNNMMANKVLTMLFDYAQYSGIGIKTALGMGGIRTSFLQSWKA